MKLSPVNIKRQEFSKSVRGFDTREVNDFLEKVADELESAIKENETLRRTIDQLNLDVERYKTIEDSLQKALIAAQESSGLALQKAHEEAAQIVRLAEAEAEKLIAGSAERAQELSKNIAVLEERKAYLFSRISAMIETQEELLGMKAPEQVSATEPPVAKKEPDLVTIPLDEGHESSEVDAPVDASVEVAGVEPSKESEEIKEKDPSKLFFSGSSEKIDINNIVED